MNLLEWIKSGFDVFKNGRTKSGITAEPITDPTDILHVTDPFRWFSEVGFDRALASIAQSEVTQFSSSQENQLREALVGRPGIGPATTRTRIETQIVVNNDTRQIQVDATRERDSFIICLTPLIWITAHIIAFDAPTRSMFQQMAMNYDAIPLLYSELFKRERNCSNGFFRFTTGIILTAWTVISVTNPELNGTLYDPFFIRTRGGLEQLLSLFAFLNTRDSNYIKMVTPTKETFPVIESAYTVTANSYTVDDNREFRRQTVFITANSQPEFNVIFATDAVLGCYHYRNLSNDPYFGHQVTSAKFKVIATNLQWAEHIVMRASGLDPNNNRTTRKPTNEDKGENKPRRGRFQNNKPSTTIVPSSETTASSQSNSFRALDIDTLDAIISKQVTATLKALLPYIIKKSDKLLLNGSFKPKLAM